ncbi:LLM class flavin-dependent oxidoreductase [Actinophytocola oryzae]|uniref:LLM class flavin-dependent oxidoreductase n=1 Tax=Actinophytocola oryzae TaxID=502181 RepID=UPI002443F482|nr:LLM class flavin-dependent oxidoreductase [Actinophytocola oryzae]
MPGPSGWAEWAELVERADHLGVDAVYLPAGDGDDPLLAAAALAGRTRWIRVVAEVAVDEELHPVHLAERIAVADQCLGGRLGVALSSPAADLLGETVAVLQLALSGLPFAHKGPRWTIPARLPANDAVSWSRVTVTPSPVQPGLPLWLTGPGAAALADERGLVWLAGADDDPADHRATSPGRPGLRAWTLGDDGRPDVLATAAALSAERDEWGLGFAFLPLGDPADIETLAHRVRPRVQLAELPSGLERYWASVGI